MKVRLIVAVCLAGAAVAVSVLYFRSRDGLSQPVVLPTGVTVSLERFTFGKEHRFVLGSLWQQLRARLPEKVFGKSGAITIERSTTNAAMVAWLVWTGPPSSILNPAPQYVVVDERGWPVNASQSLIYSRPTNSVMIEGRVLPLPRSGNGVRLRLHLFREGRSECVADFPIQIPRSRASPPLTPEPLPIQRRDAEVEFVLSGLQAERDVKTNRGFATPLNTFTFEIFEKGRRSTNWQLRWLRATDARGSENSYSVSSYPLRNGDEQWTGNWLLWPDEPWRVQAKFARRGDFSADELWQIRDIPVLVSNSAGLQPYRTNLQGIALTVRGISDNQGRLPDGTMSVNATTNVLDITWSPSPSGIQVSLIEAVDDGGHKVEIRGSVGGNHGTIGYELALPAGVRTISATIAVRRSRKVEFTVQPRLMPLDGK